MNTETINNAITYGRKGDKKINKQDYWKKFIFVMEANQKKQRTIVRLMKGFFN